MLQKVTPGASRVKMGTTGYTIYIVVKRLQSIILQVTFIAK